MRKHSKKILLLAITLALVTCLYIFTSNKTVINSNISTINQPSVISTFKSERVPLSFGYPSSFPVRAATKQYEVGYLSKDNGVLEHVEFSDTFIPNARDDTYGYIIISLCDQKNSLNCQLS